MSDFVRSLTISTLRQILSENKIEHINLSRSEMINLIISRQFDISKYSNKLKRTSNTEQLSSTPFDNNVNQSLPDNKSSMKRSGPKLKNGHGISDSTYNDPEFQSVIISNTEIAKVSLSTNTDETDTTTAIVENKTEKVDSAGDDVAKNKPTIKRGKKAINKPSEIVPEKKVLRGNRVSTEVNTHTKQDSHQENKSLTQIQDIANTTNTQSKRVVSNNMYNKKSIHVVLDVENKFIACYTTEKSLRNALNDHYPKVNIEEFFTEKGHNGVHVVEFKSWD